ncbi:hypothetical protein GGX14DRAFT_374768 [Mycena pura]|uniref:CxC1-like cysteine cluster associated with KDZ transposases domain-containing protein n=1 Tax=Mycena pura TaxID=153505 RepID=A0AAD6Y5L5_9AGAR|nr:hypothetical protein GGX14DRAFT_374768 [Mycena pura]
MFGACFLFSFVLIAECRFVADTSDVDVKLDPRGGGIAPALILAGLVPCAPYEPTVAITVRVLEAFHVLHARAPQLAVQPYVKSLCDLHGVPFRPYLSQQFSIAYDVYLAIHRETDERVMSALGRDFKWRLKHACPACMYKLEGEDELIFDMLTTMDGNDSLKRVLRRSPSDGEGDGEPMLGRSKERVDNRDAGDGYYLSRERVDTWAKTRLGELLPTEAHPHPLTVDQGEDNPCADRWKNMVNDVTSKMWGIFDEPGVFLALCRHGFVLVIADMLRSGELAKYPLAVVQELLDVFGIKLGAGYDIGCHFDATAARDHKLREALRQFRDVRQPQCVHLSHFVLALLTTYLGKFLCTNYWQALNILKTEPALQDWMRQERLESFDEFHQWLLEEKEYLIGLKHAAKTNVETLEMEYVQKLVNLSASEAKYAVVLELARHARADHAAYTPGISKAELARRHAKEKVEKDLECVQALEVQLDVAERWTAGSPKWVSTVVEIKQRKYQLALDALELLIVERIFELTKMNQSQTGYKLRKHIAKALQARSKAVKYAIDNYNAAAGLLDPPMPYLGWEQVVEYAFLADFDILRDTRPEVQSRSWARPAYRLAMDRYFRILRAREEIKRLNVEIPHVVTWIRDEYKALRRKEQELEDESGKTEEEAEADGGLALQVRKYRQRRGRFDDGHMRRFWALAKEPGFTGSLLPGKALEVLAAQREARKAERAERAARAAAMRGERERDGMQVDSSDEEDPRVRPSARAARVRRARQVESSDEEEEEEGEQVTFAHETASSWRRGVDEEMQAGWSDEEGDEEVESALSEKVYMLSILATDGVTQEG